MISNMAEALVLLKKQLVKKQLVKLYVHSDSMGFSKIEVNWAAKGTSDRALCDRIFKAT